ncbi:hypothetical protein BaRGS_00003880, partial [Batillaria attramentaria]
LAIDTSKVHEEHRLEEILTINVAIFTDRKSAHTPGRVNASHLGHRGLAIGSFRKEKDVHEGLQIRRPVDERLGVFSSLQPRAEAYNRQNGPSYAAYDPGGWRLVLVGRQGVTLAGFTSLNAQGYGR